MVTTRGTSPRARATPARARPDRYRSISPRLAGELRELHTGAGMTIDELADLYQLDYANILRVIEHPRGAPTP